MVKAVLLDVDNTLLDFNLSAKQAMKSAAAELGLTFSEKIFSTFLTVNDALWRKIEKKEMTREELHKVRWGIIFDRLNIPADGNKMETLFLGNLADVAIPVEGAVDIVRYLSGKYKVYTASNAPYSQQVKRLTDSGILPFVTRILNFEERGINKPQPKFFEECLRAVYPATKEETAIIGDSLSADMAGGKTVGFITVWFNHDGLNVQRPDNCDYMVNSLEAIKSIL